MAILRALKWILGSIAAVVVILGVALYLLFGVFLGPSEDEVARVTSPAGDIDAVLIETNGGATTSFGYEVFVVGHGRLPKKKPVAYLYGAIRSENAYGLNMRWPEPDLLVIEYMRAKNAVLEKDVVSVGGKLIRVTMRSGVVNLAAPSGGMLFNLKGRQ
ncbi:MAG: hypothetical protein WC324_02375 [Candidatus Omnitrophota bacterium]|jgi:hypothetical protein